MPDLVKAIEALTAAANALAQSAGRADRMTLWLTAGVVLANLVLAIAAVWSARLAAASAKSAERSSTASQGMLTLEMGRRKEELESHPELDMATSGQPPDCFVAKVETEDGRGDLKCPPKVWADCCWLRIPVRNKGTVSAQNVEVYITELHRYEHGSWRRRRFAPRRLVWGNTPVTDKSPEEPVLPNLHREIEQYCDLGRIVDPEIQRWRFFASGDAPHCVRPVLELQVDWHFPPFDHALDPGRYQLVIALACANTRPTMRKLELGFSGWCDHEKMLSQGIRMKLVD